MSILEEIVAHTRTVVAERIRVVPIDGLKAEAASRPAPRGFRDALVRADAGRSVIAEVKKASPSKGLIREDFDAVEIAEAYAGGGARALSVLTDEKYFQGHLDYLRAVRQAVELPILRKDFMVDEYQVWEARAAGADAILLIMAALSDAEIPPLASVAAELGMDVLWEVHDAEELARLQKFSPRLVGINNRNLKTFEVSLETTRTLLPQLPKDAVSVSESGFFEPAELEQLCGWGVDAFLIGESLMRQLDPGAALRRLVGGE